VNGNLVEKEKPSIFAGMNFDLIPKVILFVATFLPVVPFISSRQWGLLLYRCDCRYWPVWFPGVLWILAATSFLVLVFRNRQTQKRIYLVSASAVVLTSIICSVWLHTLFKLLQVAVTVFFQEGMIPYIDMPITEIFATGHVTRSLLVLVALLFATFTLLLICRVRIKKQKTESIRRED
jgi:hypothetical protein